MEVVNQIIAFFTPYLGEYARYVPVAIGTILAIIAFVIRRRFVSKMHADIAAAKKKDIEASKTSDDEDTLSETVAVEVETVTTTVSKAVDIETPVESELVKADVPSVDVAVEPEPKAPTLSWAQRIKSGLSRTRSGLGNGLSSVIGASKKVDDDLLEELETQLLTADVGIDATQALIAGLTDKLNRKELKNADALLTHLKADMEGILGESQQV